MTGMEPHPGNFRKCGSVPGARPFGTENVLSPDGFPFPEALPDSRGVGECGAGFPAIWTSETWFLAMQDTRASNVTGNEREWTWVGREDGEMRTDLTGERDPAPEGARVEAVRGV